MPHVDRHATWVFRLSGQGLFPSPSRIFQLWMSLSLLLTIFPSTVAAQAFHSPLAVDPVPQARVNPRTIRLPIVDGTDLRFARTSMADGLSQTKAGQIGQDDQGFMWFGTQYGLNRFDGYNFKVLVHDPGNQGSLSGVFISALFKDRDGVLWVGCDQFLNKFDRETETFTRYPVPFVTHISQDSAGILWLATGTSLYGLDPATGRIRQYSHDPKDPWSLSSSHVKSSGEDKSGRFWVANTEGLDEFDRRTGKVILHIPEREPSSELSFRQSVAWHTRRWFAQIRPRPPEIRPLSQ